MPKQTRNRRRPLETRLNFRINKEDRETIDAAAGNWSSPSEICRFVMHSYCDAVRKNTPLTLPLRFMESNPQMSPNEPKPRDKK
jgi:hypothetical protein